jgi:hypothetical protein
VAIRANRQVFVEADLESVSCLCSNCHREVHSGVTNIPENVDESFTDITEKRNGILVQRAVRRANNYQVTGSVKSSHPSREVIDWIIKNFVSSFKWLFCYW